MNRLFDPTQTPQLSEDNIDNTSMGYNAVAQQITTASSKPSDQIRHTK